ncbi:periplasmic nitrate reductase, NapE protein [Sulfitobacter sp. D35]|uniref:periplasmic nitrate reductase, NapE protein n=1 Tax=Sulfitobacter sp. D35 TaxID=3083252 RepID=UPI00296E89A3|nr:periplasmic nitrate reductase, NapE protein [Sulfitobacter sp. D35]MDW4498497.1 periplasmic nitrate reductase, NapE protein [Sulfitobacter sp. D35]
MAMDESDTREVTRAEERNVFVFLAIFLAPILAVMIVGGYGFIVWMYQLIYGPPGPHGG